MLQALFQSAQHLLRKGKDPEPDPNPDPHLCKVFKEVKVYIPMNS
jgi:hypothetical protein